jgi:hypothetical protein
VFKAGKEIESDEAFNASSHRFIASTLLLHSFGIMRLTLQQ